MGTRESIILAFTGLIIGIILGGWVEKQIPNAIPAGQGMITSLLTTFLMIIGIRLGKNQDFTG